MSPGRDSEEGVLTSAYLSLHTPALWTAHPAFITGLCLTASKSLKSHFLIYATKTTKV